MRPCPRWCWGGTSSDPRTLDLLRLDRCGPNVGDRDSAGSSKLTVPNLVGKSTADATAALRAAGFENDLEIDSAPLDCGEHPPKVKARQILCQKPAAGETADRGAYIYAVTFYDPRNPDVIARADLEALVGLTIDQAKARLVQLQFSSKLEVRTA